MEFEIHGLLSHYSNHLNSIVAHFPAQAIVSVLDTHAASIENKQERDAFYMQTQVSAGSDTVKPRTYRACPEEETHGIYIWGLQY